ncbi:hypothetical protein GCM10023063_21780 [Arthrobacter methylotrophus]|uniref:DUF1508 domain-containing protein n=1 Tax=Arthrobacter methylotrophus TaxID=121291 RepID=A0ABV5UMK7_9MICC
MAGHLELMDAPEGGYRVALVDKDDFLVAMSVTFSDGGAAARGIASIREIAGTPTVRDRRHGHDEMASARNRRASSSPADAEERYGQAAGG